MRAPSAPKAPAPDPAAAARALAHAKAVAFRFAGAVRERDARMVRVIAGQLDAAEKTALAVVLAEALPDLIRLKIIKDADD